MTLVGALTPTQSRHTCRVPSVRERRCEVPGMFHVTASVTWAPAHCTVCAVVNSECESLIPWVIGMSVHAFSNSSSPCKPVFATHRDTSGRCHYHSEQVPELRSTGELAGHSEGWDCWYHDWGQWTWEWVQKSSSFRQTSITSCHGAIICWYFIRK